ncbi:MAG: HEAT repeat domain-containing protein [Isosphaeraceae bacterium]|nr:HEAT repeat domain-containing protein [Isosphaeraceae bacterium]
MDVVLRDLRPAYRSVAIGATVLALMSGCSSFPGTTAASFLRKVEQSRDPNERYQAYQNLGTSRAYRDEAEKIRAVELLSKRLSRPNDSDQAAAEPTASRAMICRTLGKIGHPSARPAMLTAVNDPDPLVRAEACLALGRVGKSEDATVLARVMTADVSPDCRIAAIDGLGALKSNDPRITGFLANAMEGDEDPAVRLASLESLRKITGKDFGVEPKPWHDYLAATNPVNRDVMTAQAPAASPSRPAPTIDPGVAAASSPR